MKGKVIVIAALTAVLVCVVTAGCISAPLVIGGGVISAGSVSAPSDVEQKTTVPGTTVPEKTLEDIAGTWYSITTYYDEGVEGNCWLKLEIHADGTGAETWNNLMYEPYCYNTFAITKTKSGSFHLDFDPPLDENAYYLTPEGDKLIASFGTGFSKTPWNVETVVKQTTHNPDDYVEDGDYYLEDQFGRSFTDTLWSGDVSEYVAPYKNHPGKWIKTVRSMSTAHHAYESNPMARYQTAAETMKRGSGTCADLAILAARGLKELGFDVAILVFPDHMDIGIAKKHYYTFRNSVTGDRYAAYSGTGKMYGDYYYLDIVDYQNILDIGDYIGETKFRYDMTLKKMIVL